MFHTAAEIRELFEKFEGIRVMIVGDVMIDSYLKGKVDRISPEAPVPVVALRDKEDMLGGAANVALNIRALGGIPLLCSVVGTDSQGSLFAELLKKEGIDASGIISLPGRITTTKYRVIGNKVQMLRVDHETDTDLSSAEETRLLETISGQITELKPGIIILQDYNKGVLTPSVIRKIAGLAAEAEIPVAVDPKKKNFDLYEGITLFKPNLKEIREGLKTDLLPVDENSLRTVCDRLRKEKDIKIVLVTLSEAGIYLNTPSLSTILRGHARSVADVSGAGDTVISIAAACLAAGIEPVRMAALANLAGGLVCEETGVVPVKKDIFLKEAIRLLAEPSTLPEYE